MHHELKLYVQYYDAAASGEKPFEIRCDDRGYQKGDTITLKPFYPPGKGYCYCSHRKPIHGTITYVTAFNQKEGWVVFGYKRNEEDINKLMRRQLD